MWRSVLLSSVVTVFVLCRPWDVVAQAGAESRLFTFLGDDGQVRRAILSDHPSVPGWIVLPRSADLMAATVFAGDRETYISGMADYRLPGAADAAFLAVLESMLRAGFAVHETTTDRDRADGIIATGLAVDAAQRRQVTLQVRAEGPVARLVLVFQEYRPEADMAVLASSSP